MYQYVQRSNQFVDWWPSHLFQFPNTWKPLQVLTQVQVGRTINSCKKSERPIYPSQVDDNRCTSQRVLATPLEKKCFEHIMANPATCSHQGHLAWVFNLFTIKWHGLIRCPSFVALNIIQQVSVNHGLCPRNNKLWQSNMASWKITSLVNDSLI